MWQDQLLNISDDFGQLYRPKANDLPQVLPRFFVPPLEDKPQNPILEVLELESITSNLSPRLFQPHLLPQELTTLSLNATQVVQQTESKVEEIWTNALVRNRGERVSFFFFVIQCVSSFPEWLLLQNGLLSWDRLRPTHSTKASPTGFLSEQDDVVYASARYL